MAKTISFTLTCNQAGTARVGYLAVNATSGGTVTYQITKNGTSINQSINTTFAINDVLIVNVSVADNDSFTWILNNSNATKMGALVKVGSSNIALFTLTSMTSISTILSYSNSINSQTIPNYFMYGFNAGVSDPYGAGNSYGGISLIPNNIFTIPTTITLIQNFCFYGFNNGGYITSIGSGNFSFDNVITVGNNFAFGFNDYNRSSGLTTLGADSFFFPNLTTVGTNFLQNFNSAGAIPTNALNLTSKNFEMSKLTTVGTEFMRLFNENGYITYTSTSNTYQPFKFNNIIILKDNFCYRFNYNGNISLPNNSFNFNSATSAGNAVMFGFNQGGKMNNITNSFTFPKLTTVGDQFLYGFNQGGNLTKLPISSFNLNTITTVGSQFCAYFNYNGALTTIPIGSFGTQSSSGSGQNSGLYNYFNYSGKLPTGTVYLKNFSNASIPFYVYPNNTTAVNIASGSSQGYASGEEPPITTITRERYRRTNNQTHNQKYTVTI